MHELAARIKFKNSIVRESVHGLARAVWTDTKQENNFIHSVININNAGLNVNFQFVISHNDINNQIVPILNAIKNNINYSNPTFLNRQLKVDYYSRNNTLDLSLPLTTCIFIYFTDDSLQVFIDYLQHFYVYLPNQKQM